MNHLSRLLLVAAAVVSALFIPPLGAGELRLGAAAVPITPPQGVPMAGYYSARYSEGVHDELYAKALVFEQ
ncbi:MAG: hypothetical protein HY300_11945, partial [Verrucomicrobia bacterium]|nr:hypothetical protein [Verrucomicrobiota bacterium]